MAEFSLTREFLLSGRLAEEIRRHAPPGLVLLSDAERSASLARMLATRPDPAGRGVLVFAYGSLIWNPMVHYVERVAAHAPDWHRAFCLSVRGGRGTPENPGLMLGLKPGPGALGAGCTGVAFRIAEALVEPELDLIWRREMVGRGYIPRWVRLQAADGTAMDHGIAFTSDPEGPGYCDPCEAEMVQRLATASGRMGTAAEYLFRTRDGLRELGIACPFVERVAALVDDHMAGA